MRVVVTGCAGFIGSAVVDHLLASGNDVVGIDVLTEYYSSRIKERNVRPSSGHPNFTFLRKDIRDVEPGDIAPADVVIHLAAQPGVRDSWTTFPEYLAHNLEATQHLAEVMVRQGCKRMVFASSSSVYGNQAVYPTTEDAPLMPRSPYGVTKAAGEKLLAAYNINHGLNVAALRFFTVYGPRQRPDMAIQRLIEAAYSGQTFPLYGDGTAKRDFTYVDDVVDACIKAARQLIACDGPPKFMPINIGGTGEVSMNELIQKIESIAERPISIDRYQAQRGDVVRTGADPRLAKEVLGWRPRTNLERGLRAQCEHVRRCLAA